MTVDELLARFEAGTATRDDVQALVDRAGDRVMIQIRVARTKPPAHGKPIKLLGKSGPASSGDRGVEHVSGPRWWRAGHKGVWAAWWRVADLRAWLASHPVRRLGVCPGCRRPVELTVLGLLSGHRVKPGGEICRWEGRRPPEIVSRPT